MYASRNLNVDGHHVGHPETSPKRRRISASQASQPAATGRARARRGHVLHTFPAHVSWNGRAQHGWRKGCTQGSTGARSGCCTQSRLLTWHGARGPVAGRSWGLWACLRASLPLEVVTHEAKAPSGQAKNNHYMYLYYFN